MMSSTTLVTASTPYFATDHRTVLKSLQSENYIHNNNGLTSKCKSYKNCPIEQIFCPTSNTSTRTYVLRRPRTKIPHPLATLWSNPKSYNFKRSSSLRVRGTKSNLPFIMEPTINEIPTMNATTNYGEVDETLVNAEGEMVKKCTTANRKNSTHETTTTAGGLISTRRKLALNNSQTESDAVDGFTTTATTQTTGTIKRSLSLRRANKILNYNNSNNGNTSNSSVTDYNKTEFPKDKLCSAKIMSKSPTQHDTVKAKDQGDGLKTSTAAAANTGHESKSSNADFVKEFNKMSLNHNGVTTQNETTGSATTTTTTSQQTRPLTLNTNNPTAVAVTTINTGSKSPKTPHNTSTNHTQTTPTVGQQQQQQKQQNQHHKHSTHSTLNKSLSPGAKQTPKTPPVTPDSPTTYLDDDLDSLFSYGTTTSGRSTMSCEHPYVARNGTTFSGRKMKYVVHCSSYAGQVGADYLTPTQRAQRQLRRLKELLCAARHDLEQKDSEILRLTREVVELRLFKASLSSPEERSASSDAVTVREAELKTSQDVSPIVDMVDDAQKTSSPRHHHHHHVHTPSAMLHQQHLPQSSLHQQQHNMLHHHLSSDMQSSFADSGHFEDMTSSSVHSKDSSYTPSLHTHDQACGSDEASLSPNNPASAATVEQYELQRQELIRLYEQRIEDLIRNQDAATSEMKRTNCDRIEALLQKLAECNTRYADIVPDYEHAKERIRELEKQLEELQRRLAEHEEKQKQMYLHMYQKGQEAERIARADQALELAHRAPQNKVSINELLHQLQSTQDELENIRTIYRRLLEAQKNRTHVDPEVTLQFLKSAVYYFLTDKENSQGHLQAIESILEFSEAEKQTINKARAAK